MTNTTIISSAVVLAMLITWVLIVRYHEKKGFNNGICPKCGKKLKHFDSDVDGNRGYRCLDCDYTTWCSYNVDKNYK